MTMKMVGIAQVIPFPGKLGARRRAVELDADAATIALDTVRLAVVRNVKTAYYELAYLDHALTIVKQSESVLTDLVGAAQSHYAVGTGGQLDVLKARILATQLGESANMLIEQQHATLAALNAAVIVALVTIIFLLHAPSALVAILTLPVGVLMAFLAMHLLGLSANVVSLGGIAIAIGAMIDAAIVMVENLHKHMERNETDRLRKRHWDLVVESAQEVGPALFISLLIITASFLPVFALQDQEGLLFKPLAWTKTLSMASAALLSITPTLGR